MSLSRISGSLDGNPKEQKSREMKKRADDLVSMKLFETCYGYHDYFTILSIISARHIFIILLLIKDL